MTETQQVQVSDSWNRKFDAIEQAGADKNLNAYFENYNSLSFSERFNSLAFLFGFLYYFAKKMWYKGAFLIGAILIFNAVLTIIENALGLTFPTAIFWIPGGVICAMSANYDYYRFCRHQETMWGGLPAIFAKPTGAIGFPVAVLLVLLAFDGLFSSNVPSCGDSRTVALVKQIATDEKGEFYSFEVDAIRTTSTNEQTGTHECAAQLEVSYSEDGTPASEIPITYTVELTDDGKQIYVGVLGLK